MKFKQSSHFDELTRYLEKTLYASRHQKDLTLPRNSYYSTRQFNFLVQQIDSQSTHLQENIYNQPSFRGLKRMLTENRTICQKYFSTPAKSFVTKDTDYDRLIKTIKQKYLMDDNIQSPEPALRKTRPLEKRNMRARNQAAQPTILVKQSILEEKAKCDHLKRMIEDMRKLLNHKRFKDIYSQKFSFIKSSRRVQKQPSINARQPIKNKSLKVESLNQFADQFKPLQSMYQSSYAETKLIKRKIGTLAKLQKGISDLQHKVNRESRRDRVIAYQQEIMEDAMRKMGYLQKNTKRYKSLTLQNALSK